MPLDLGKLKEKFERREGSADKLSLKDGDNYVRLLPPTLQFMTEVVDYIELEHAVHYIPTVEGKKQAETCPKSVNKNGKCPICETVFKLYKTGLPDDKALAGTLRAKKRHLFNAMDLNDLDKGIQILETGPKIRESLIVFITNPKWGDLLDVDKGRNVTITKTPAEKTQSGYIEYSVAPDPDVTEIRSKLPKDFKTQIEKLKKCAPPAKTYEELKAILEGESGETKPEATTEESAEPVHTKPAMAKPAAAVAKPAVRSAAPAKPVAEVSEAGDAPECFGKDFGPKKDECRICGSKEACREEFLKVD